MDKGYKKFTHNMKNASNFFFFSSSSSTLKQIGKDK